MNSKTAGCAADSHKVTEEEKDMGKGAHEKSQSELESSCKEYDINELS